MKLYLLILVLICSGLSSCNYDDSDTPNPSQTPSFEYIDQFVRGEVAGQNFILEEGSLVTQSSINSPDVKEYWNYLVLSDTTRISNSNFCYNLFATVPEYLIMFQYYNSDSTIKLDSLSFGDYNNRLNGDSLILRAWAYPNGTYDFKRGVRLEPIFLDTGYVVIDEVNLDFNLIKIKILAGNKNDLKNTQISGLAIVKYCKF